MLRTTWMAAIALCGHLAAANAAQIDYSVNFIEGNSWQYEYTVINDSPSPLGEFTIWFGADLYQNLRNATTPIGWDPFVAQSDPALPSDGFFDALALNGLLLEGLSASGFSVEFDYLGMGTPGGQLFEVIDPDTFAVLGSGTTRLPGPVTNPVPEPASLALTSLALALLALFRRNPRRNSPA